MYAPAVTGRSSQGSHPTYDEGGEHTSPHAYLPRIPLGPMVLSGMAEHAEESCFSSLSKTYG